MVAPVAVIAATPVPSSLSLGGALSTGGVYVVEAAAAAAGEVLTVVVAVLLDVLLLDSTPERPLLQSPLNEQASRSEHQCSGASHLSRSSNTRHIMGRHKVNYTNLALGTTG